MEGRRWPGRQWLSGSKLRTAWRQARERALAVRLQRRGIRLRHLLPRILLRPEARIHGLHSRFLGRRRRSSWRRTRRTRRCRSSRSLSYCARCSRMPPPARAEPRFLQSYRPSRSHRSAEHRTATSGTHAEAGQPTYRAKYVVARFCPLLVSFLVARPSFRTLGISRTSSFRAARICSARRPPLLDLSSP